MISEVSTQEVITSSDATFASTNVSVNFTVIITKDSHSVLSETNMISEVSTQQVIYSTSNSTFASTNVGVTITDDPSHSGNDGNTEDSSDNGAIIGGSVGGGASLLFGLIMYYCCCDNDK